MTADYLQALSLALTSTGVAGALVWAIRTVVLRHLSFLDRIAATLERHSAAIEAFQQNQDKRAAEVIEKVVEQLTDRLDLDRRLASIEAATGAARRSHPGKPPRPGAE